MAGQVTPGGQVGRRGQAEHTRPGRCSCGQVVAGNERLPDTPPEGPTSAPCATPPPATFAT